MRQPATRAEATARLVRDAFSDYSTGIMDDFTLKQFTAVDQAASSASYVSALEAFDGIEQLQELKSIARQRGGIAPGKNILDVGCGFGLETLRLAALGPPRGLIAGVDKSADFIQGARDRAAAAKLKIDFRVADAMALPFDVATFDCVRAERLLIYLDDVTGAISEMRRVAKPGGGLALIEPEFSSTTVNLPNRPLVRRVMAHEVDTAVVVSWLPGQLPGILADHGFTSIEMASRVLVFPQGLGAMYFRSVGHKAAEAGIITPGELQEWSHGVDSLHDQSRLFGEVGYFLFTARSCS
jgi:ubiquinone/menaquinone biosynthesis C-methylase UbiE